MDLNTYYKLIASESRARKYLLEKCFKNHQRFCPRCRSRKLYKLQEGRYRCSRCEHTFHDFSGRWINRGRLSSVQWLSLIKLFELEVSVRKMALQLKLSWDLWFFQNLILALFSTRLFKKSGLGREDYRRTLINFSVMATRFTSKYSVMGAVSWMIRPLFRLRADLSLYLHRPEDSTPSEQIEGHLSEETIHGIFDYPGKPGAKRMTMQVA